MTSDLDQLIALQAIWPAIFLLAGGGGKASAKITDDSLVTKFLGSGVASTRVLPIAEVVAGALVLAAWPSSLLGSIPAAVCFVTASVAIELALRRSSAQDCGCMGALGRARVSRKTLSRACLLAAMATVAVIAPAPWYDGIPSLPVALIALLEGTLLLGPLSPDLRLAQRLRLARFNCDVEPILPGETLNVLRGTRLWARIRGDLRSLEPIDTWREACWRFLSFPAVYRGRQATAVFAVHLGRSRRLDAVALVDDQTDQVLHDLAARSLGFRLRLSERAD